MTPKVVAIIQARMGSSRLPGKVLLDIGAETMLGRVVGRTTLCSTVNEVLVATTTDRADNTLADYCEQRAVHYTRGSHFDVLDRYHEAAHGAKADVVVRITADCPLIDPSLVDDVVRTILVSPNSTALPQENARRGGTDLALNRLPPPWKRTYPIGLDTEVCTMAALERAWNEAREPQQREHVMPYMYEGVELARADGQVSFGRSPRGFSIALLDHVVDLGLYRWTVDTAEDLEFVRQIYRYLGDRIDFSWIDVLDLLRARPELRQINASVRHKSLREIDERGTGN